MPFASLRHVAFGGVFASLAACSSSSSDVPNEQRPTSPESAPDGGAPPVITEPSALDWKACDLDPRKKASGGAECATLPSPRDHASPGGPTITLGMKRVVHGDTPPRVQLWLVDGGPGGSVVNAFKTLGRSALTRTDVAVYGVDHRGVGGSQPLDCPAQEAATSEVGAGISDAEWPACVAELESRERETLPFITTSDAMRDLALAIERTRVPGAKVIVYGGSYGTYAVLRFMKLFPKLADAVVLEGIAPPGRNFDPYDAQMDGAAHALFDACKDTPSCAARLGPDPWATAKAVVASFDTGHCPTLNLDSDGARAFLGNYLFFNPIRDYLPVLVYRMKRCETRDVTALVKFYKAYAGISMSQPELGLAFNDGKRDNQALFFHIALSEMWHWDELPDPTTVLAKWREGTMSTGLTVRLAQRQATWPVYTRGPEVDAELPPFDRPMLMLQGALDAATTVEPARRLETTYRAPGQTWAEFPQGSHMIISATPTTTGGDCGANLLDQFLDDPAAPLDTSCISQVAPIGFDGTPGVSKILLGVSDAWDG